MKLLVIICAHEFETKWCPNIAILSDYMKVHGDVEYCGISNQDDFHNYESIVQFKHKIINPKRQFSKLCDFITEHRAALDHDWFMKIRPDVKLLENIDFGKLAEHAVNARARVYTGPKKIKYGISVGGEGNWKHMKEARHAATEREVVLDDMLFIFHKNIVELNAFDPIEPEIAGSEEWKQTKVFTDRKIPLNVVGIYLVNLKHNTFSGDINI